MDEDRILGPCIVCERGRAQEGGRLAQHAADHPRQKSGKRFVGCGGWTLDDPESCDQTFPLPQRGDVFRLEDRCSICGETPRLKVVPFRGRPWKLCLNDDCPSMEEMKRKKAERAPRRRPRRPRRPPRKTATRSWKARRRDEGRAPTARSERAALEERAKPGKARPIARGPCSSRSRASTARARARRRSCSPRRWAPRRCWSASRAAPRRRSGSASCSPTPSWSSTPSPSCCSSARRAPTWSPR